MVLLNQKQQNQCFFYFYRLKMLKKAKIINMSLSTAKDSHPNTIHLSHDYEQQLVQNNISFKQKHMIDACYKAIKIISNQKVKVLQNEKRMMMRSTVESFRQTKKTEKESEIKIPISIVDTVEIILKRFLKVKADEQQQMIGINSSKMKQVHKKSNCKTFLLRKSKENAFGSAPILTEEDQCGNIFNPLSSNLVSSEKLQNKVNDLQRQVSYYRQKLGEQNGLVAKLESKEMLLKKRCNDQIIKLMRNKNILNIHTNFLKEFDGKQDRRHMLNINGKNITNTQHLNKQEENFTKRSSQMAQEVVLRQPEKIKQKKVIRQVQSQQLFKRFESSYNAPDNYPITEIKNSAQSSKIVSSKKFNEYGQGALKNENGKSIKLAKLKKQVEDLQRERDKVLDELSAITQKYENTLDIIDKKIIGKMKEINIEEELLTDQELKMLKDQEFQVMEVNGFYGPSEPGLMEDQP